MADLRISQLPLATGPTAPAPTDVTALDGLTTRKAPLSSLADAIRPIASQSEAEAGANAVKGMSPLTTKQSIASEIGETIQPFSSNLAALGGAVDDARSFLSTAPYVESRAALKLLNPSKDKVAILYENGRQGIFNWYVGDFSSSVSVDTQEAVYIASNSVSSSVGAWVRFFDGSVDVKWFGAKGDYITDDTTAITAWVSFFDATGFPLFLSEGIYKCTNNLVLPKGVIIRGVGSAKIGTFPQTDQSNKNNLRPGFKQNIRGSNIIFSGTPTNVISGGRSSTTNIRPMAIYNQFSPCDIQGVGFLQDMDVFTAGGVLTTKTNDNRGLNYTHGFFNRSTLSRFQDVTIFGYFFGGRGFVHENVAGDDGGSGNDPDYPSIDNCYISSGVAIWGSDVAQTEGNTGSQWTNTKLFGCDHHTRADSDPNIPCLEIDIHLTTVQQGRGHSFTNCNFRTVANRAVYLDYCNDVSFIGGTTEFSEVAGVPGLDQRGEFVGTANTQNITIVSLAATGNLGLATLRKTISGKMNLFGGAGASLSSMVNIQNVRTINGDVLTVSGGVITPTHSQHSLNSSGDPIVTSIDLTNILENEFLIYSRSGSGTVTFQSGGNISLRRGWPSLTLDSLSDTIIFQKRGSNAYLIAFENLGGGTDTVEIPRLIKRNFTIDLPSLASGGSGSTQTVTFPEASLGDACNVSCSSNLQGLTVTSYVSAAGSVVIRVINQTGAAVDLPSSNFTVFLFKG